MRFGVGTLTLVWLLLSCNVHAAPDLDALFLSIEGIDYEVELEKSALTERTQIISENISADAKLDIELYRGTLPDVSNSWIAVSYYEDTWSGLASLHDKLFEINGANFGTLMTNKGEVNITSMLTTELALTGDFDITNMCATPHIQTGSVMDSAQAQTAPNTNLAQLNNVALAVGVINNVANVALALDHFYLTSYGAGSVARAMQILNNVDVIYRNDLGVALNNVVIQTYTAAAQFPINQPDTLDAEILLNEIFNFQANVFGNNDQTLAALLTTRDLAVPGVGNGVAGIAPLDATCFNQGGLNLAVSVNEDRGGIGIASIILAHEMGHNFGSEHDPMDSNDPNFAACPAGQFIMSPFVAANATAFSTCSQLQIANHIALGNCYKEPIDVALARAGNAPLDNLTEGQTITRQLTVTNNGTVAIENVVIDGDIDNVQIAKFNNVTIGGQVCTLLAAEKSYQCNISSLDINNPQTITETIQAVGLGTFNFSSTFNNPNATQRIDIISDNQTINDTRTVNQAAVAPNAPTGLTATAQTNGNIALTWNDNSANEASYQVQRSENSVTFTVITNLPANTVSFDDDKANLQAGTLYTYQVFAINNIGIAASNQSSATALEPTVSVNTASSSGGGGGGGLFYVFPIILLFARAILKSK